MDSEEFAITSNITSQSALVLAGFTAQSCQLIVPHSVTSVDICVVVSSRYVEFAALELKASYSEDLERLDVLDRIQEGVERFGEVTTSCIYRFAFQILSVSSGNCEQLRQHKNTIPDVTTLFQTLHVIN